MLDRASPRCCSPSPSARSATCVGAAVAGSTPVWDLTSPTSCYYVLGNVLSLLVGFMLGVLIRNSAGAIVAYFVYAFAAADRCSALLAANQEWFHDLQPWVDSNFAQNALFHGALTGEQWAQLGVTIADLAGRPAAGRPARPAALRGQVGPAGQSPKGSGSGARTTAWARAAVSRRRWCWRQSTS